MLELTNYLLSILLIAVGVLLLASGTIMRMMLDARAREMEKQEDWRYRISGDGWVNWYQGTAWLVILAGVIMAFATKAQADKVTDFLLR